MNRNEHLAWAKQRALEYVDRGELVDGVTSMLSDLRKHPELKGSADTFVATLAMYEVKRGAAAVRHWIEGFN